MGPAERAYRALFRVVLMRMDPERAHALAMLVIRALGASPALAGALRRCMLLGRRGRTAMGIRFPTAFGLAAGFDKSAVAVRGLGALGFGHVEIGTVTPRPQSGNPRPRLFRLPADGALVNRMGFNNAGAAAVAAHLAALRRHGGLPVIGVNIGKNRDTPVHAAVTDYRICARLLAPLADYLVVNVSSPNTPGLRGLQEVDRLEPLLAAVLEESAGTPLLVKIAPDLGDDAVRDVAALVSRLGLAGVVATNTTTRRAGLRTPAEQVAAMGEGGLSGPPLRSRSLEVVRLLRDALPPAATIVSVGGVMTATDVRRRLEAGADLVQGYTGFLYRGPTWARAVTA